MEEKKEEQGDLLRGRSRRQAENPGGKKNILRIGCAAAALVILAAGCGIGYYFMESGKYVTAFFPNTTINGINVSGKTVEDVKAEIENGLMGYELKVLSRNGKEESITKDEIGLHTEFDGSLEKLLGEQDSRQWIRHVRSASSYQIDTMLAYDEERLSERIKALDCMDKKNMREPENAKISEYDSSTKSYSVIPADQGTELVYENVERAIKNAVGSLAFTVDLDAEDCYTRPGTDASDEGLQTAVTELNRYVGAVVTHTFGDETEVLDGDRIHTWLSVEGNQVVLDETQAAAYVKEVADRRNTAYKNKTLKTSYGPTVTISRGHYGWRIDQEKETEAVLAIVKAGEQQTREPEYLQKAASHGENDYGNTYVEINLTAQHLYFYKNGKLLVESDFVSGNEARGWSTPSGAYPLTYKQRNATLRGEGYATPVSYWMPFNGGIGLHDANWRGSFGGSIYKTNGSHGCINLPPSVAKTIFENISAGDPVLCYHLSGTESKKTSQIQKPKPAETTAAVTTAAPQPEQTAPETAPQPEQTAPAGPSVEVPPGNTAGPGETSPAAESSPQETPASPIETRPVGPGAPGGTVPQSGGDKEGIGPGFASPVQEQTEAPVGPGY